MADTFAMFGGEMIKRILIAFIAMVAISQASFASTVSSLERISPNPTTFTEGVDWLAMNYSGFGTAEAGISLASDGLNLGCSATDFGAFTAGTIALVSRGSCFFRTKAENALASGAIGVLIYNDGTAPDRVDVTLGTLQAPQFALPVMSLSYALGLELASQSNPVIRMTVVAPIPLPAGFPLLLAALGGLAFAARRRKTT